MLKLTPDLGKYADAVLSSYAVSIILIVGLVVLSLRHSAKVQKQLAEVEARAALKARD
jgi:heme exporter protein D